MKKKMFVFGRPKFMFLFVTFGLRFRHKLLCTCEEEHFCYFGRQKFILVFVPFDLREQRVLIFNTKFRVCKTNSVEEFDFFDCDTEQIFCLCEEEDFRVRSAKIYVSFRHV